MDEFDLEELESRLYSQVYHSSEEIDEDTLPVVNIQGESMQRSSNPYYGRNSYRPRHDSSYIRVDNRSPGSYSKKYKGSRQRDISINQLVVVNPSRRRVVCMSKPGNSRRKKKRQQPDLYNNQRQKRQEIIEILNKPPKAKHIRFTDEKDDTNGVIVLTDSDEDDSCVVVPNNWPVVAVADSEDESKLEEKLTKLADGEQSQVDDIIFVEPAPPEIISLDDESEADLSKTSLVTENSPSKYSPAERKELLSTPDSTSNDFIHPTAELRQHKFNFSLHGSDFSNTAECSKTTETCETESSSSTTDVNPLKCTVFNEIEFPKEDLFSESNLDNFMNFITPKGKCVEKVVHSSTPKKVLPRSSTPKRNTRDSSDSSSESDYEESKTDYSSKKKLPNLSQITASNELPQKPTTAKSSKGLSSTEQDKEVRLRKRHSDQLDKELESSSSKKKNKKKKKRDSQSTELNLSQSNDESQKEDNVSPLTNRESIDMPTDTSNTENVENISEQRKRKTSVSAMMSDENSESGASKKKRNKRQKSEESNSFHAEAPPENQEESTLAKEKSDVPGSVMVEVIGSQTEFVSINEISDIKLEKPDEDEASICSKAVNDSSVQLKSLAPLREEISTVEPLQQSVVVKTEVVTESDNNINSEKPQPGDIVNDFENTDNDIILLNESFKEIIEVIDSSDSSVLSGLNTSDHNIQLANCQQPDNSENAGPSDVTVTKETLNLITSSIQEIQNAMSDDPRLWTVLNSDRFALPKKSRGPKCNRCKEFGHIASRCLKEFDLICNLCGCREHLESRCPKKICMGCGRKNYVVTSFCKSCFHLRNVQCELCQVFGHTEENCPDLWRRFHLTTSDGPLVKLDGPSLKPKEKLWCSGCAQSGHLEYYCNYYTPSYSLANPEIQSYENTYSSKGSERTPRKSRRDRRESYVRPSADQLVTPTTPVQQQFGQPEYSINSLYNPGCNNIFLNLFSGSLPLNMHLANPELALFTQQHILNSVIAQNILSHSTVQQPTPVVEQNNFQSEDSLPEYITFDTPLSSQNEERNVSQGHSEVSNTNTCFEHKEPRWIRERNNYHLFCRGRTDEIKTFLNSELQYLKKIKLNVKEIVKNLRRGTVPVGNKYKIGRHYRMLNMILFGVHGMNEGESHYRTLKTFEIYSRSKINNEKREALYKSYCYIFGTQKQSVDYDNLLTRI